MFITKMTSKFSVQTSNPIGADHFRFAFIYHLSKDTPLRRTDTVPSGLGASAPPHNMDEPDLTRQASDQKVKPNFK